VEKGLLSGFLSSFAQHPSRTALEVNHKDYTYQELGSLAAAIASAIERAQPHDRTTAAFLAYRSITAYAGVLGILASGRGYVPLNPSFPLERTFRMLSLSGTDVLIVGAECLGTFEALLPHLEKPMLVLADDVDLLGDLVHRFPQHRYISYAAQGKNTHPGLVEVTQALAPAAAAPAYLLFTSGSTGVPKGVPVSHANVHAYVEYVASRYGVNQNDRFSQMFDMTFDLSVHDMFVAWQRGACVCCVPEKYLMSPADFIRNRQLTMWFSVPSVAMFMSGYRMLKPDSLPGLRYSLFCGEALSATLADQWQKAASNSIVENLYGPTETTIAIAHYRWEATDSPAKCLNGVVPIGWMFAGQQAAIIPADGCEYEDDGAVRRLQSPLCADGVAGELCLCGSQVTQGYLNNPEKTREQYVRIPALGENIWYRTGDLAKRDTDGCLYYLGRIDNQVKILGYRVELGEIDAVLRQAAGTENAVSLPHPLREGRATGVVAFVAGKPQTNEKSILAYCQKHLPDYMLPKRVYFIEEMPLNVNGKIDRLKLKEMLEHKQGLQ